MEQTIRVSDEVCPRVMRACVCMRERVYVCLCMCKYVRVCAYVFSGILQFWSIL